MMALRIDAPPLLWPLLRIATLAGIALGFTLLKSPGAFFPLVAICLPLAATESWRQFLKAQRAVVIDKASGLVTVHTMSIWGRPRTASYPLDMFRFVTSYITPGKVPLNYLELVSKSGGEALPLRDFAPAVGDTPFLSLHTTLLENHDACILRGRVARYAGLEDKGFVGKRMPGALLSDRGR
ncbi:MAG: hypothetical protein EON54_03780 [Alcaligenaceae bacterium]|nr:MAG: hypothetical protein EON54_03780 [Alcaligenaceae bacterium]